MNILLLATRSSITVFEINMTTYFYSIYVHCILICNTRNITNHCQSVKFWCCVKVMKRRLTRLCLLGRYTQAIDIGSAHRHSSIFIARTHAPVLRSWARPGRKGQPHHKTATFPQYTQCLCYSGETISIEDHHQLHRILLRDYSDDGLLLRPANDTSYPVQVGFRFAPFISKLVMKIWTIMAIYYDLPISKNSIKLSY